MLQPFRFGLNMPGTISAGAYTAGVVDFLIDAMDAWYAERKRQIQAHGDRFEEWDIPPHEMELSVLSGASGGGIVAALTAAALVKDFHGVRVQSPSPGTPTNVLYNAWVNDIDIRPLLGDTDLDPSGGSVTSILNSDIIREIASNSFLILNPRQDRREWVRDGLKIILTLTNLRGVPYAVEPQTDADSARTLSYADRRQFEVLWNQPRSGGETLPLSACGGSEWADLGNTAIATSALPAMLAPELLSRKGVEYNHRTVSIDRDRPKPSADGDCECASFTTVPPDWPVQDEEVFDTLNVDGGVTNNSPFEFARLELASLNPPSPSGRNVRDPQLADRFVISVAPLETAIPAQLPPLPSSNLGALIARCIAALLNQSRIEGEDLKLASDPKVFSRWVIAPTVDNMWGKEPLAGALLGGFNAFLSQLFREYDYQLGRRNCQRFLRAYLGVPKGNMIMQQSGISAKTQRRLDKTFGFDSPNGKLLPLIPVMPELQEEVKPVRNSISEAELSGISAMAADRLARVLKPMVLGEHPALLAKLAFDGIWAVAKSRIEDGLVNYAGSELQRFGFLNGLSGGNALLDEIRGLRTDIASLK